VARARPLVLCSSPAPASDARVCSEDSLHDRLSSGQQKAAADHIFPVALALFVLAGPPVRREDPACPGVPAGSHRAVVGGSLLPREWRQHAGGCSHRPAPAGGPLRLGPPAAPLSYVFCCWTVRTGCRAAPALSVLLRFAGMLIQRFFPPSVRRPLQLDAKDKEIQQLKEELKAAKEYSQVCEDESVELRRKVFEMSKEMNKLKKDLEQLTRAADKKKPADLTPMPTPAPSTGLTSTSRKRSTRKTMGDTVMLEASASGEGSDSAPSGGDHDMSSTAPRRSARRAGRPPSTVGLDLEAAAPVPKRKASARAAAASTEREERPAPASSKKKRMADAASTASSADSESDKVEARPDIRAERAVGETRQVTGCAGGMGEHPDPPSEEDQEAAEPPATAGEQMQLLDILAEASLQLQAGWIPRMKALKRLRLLFTTPGLLKCNRGDFVQKMLQSLVVQSADARSQIVRETCSLITEILPFLEGHYDDVAKILLPQLWKLTYVSLRPVHLLHKRCAPSTCSTSVEHLVCNPLPPQCCRWATRACRCW